MRRIKFIRQVKLFFNLSNQKTDLAGFEPLIKKLPAKQLDKEFLKNEFNKFCQKEHGFSLKESKEFYSQIMSAKPDTYSIQSAIGSFRKRGLKVTSTEPYQGGAPGSGKKK